MGVRVQSASKEGSRGGGVEWCHATRHLGHLARAVARVERLALGTLAQRVPLVEHEGTSYVGSTCARQVDVRGACAISTPVGTSCRHALYAHPRSAHELRYPWDLQSSTFPLSST